MARGPRGIFLAGPVTRAHKDVSELGSCADRIDDSSPAVDCQEVVVAYRRSSHSGFHTDCSLRSTRQSRAPARRNDISFLPKLRSLTLLDSAIAVWATNLLIFSMAYWRIDRGGPEARSNVIPLTSRAKSVDDGGKHDLTCDAHHRCRARSIHSAFRSFSGAYQPEVTSD